MVDGGGCNLLDHLSLEASKQETTNYSAHDKSIWEQKPIRKSLIFFLDFDKQPKI